MNYKKALYVAIPCILLAGATVAAANPTINVPILSDAIRLGHAKLQEIHPLADSSQANPRQVTPSSLSAADAAKQQAIQEQLDKQFPPTQKPSVDVLTVALTNPDAAKLLTQSGRVDAHVSVNPNLEDITFCGNAFKARQITIDGVDVVKRLADFFPTTLSGNAAQDTPEMGFCRAIGKGPSSDVYTYRIAELLVSDVTAYNENGQKYRFDVYGMQIEVDEPAGDIYMVNAYSGSTMQPALGNLKK
jgi:hypothetical protein